MRNLILIILVVVAVWWIRRQIMRIGEVRARRAAETPPAQPSQQMLACAHCGVHAPEGEGVKEGELFYCCAAHRSLGPRR